MSTPSQRPQRPLLTVALVVRDAAQLLAQTLSCVDRIADELLLVDTGSADQTRHVAQQYGAHIVERPWDDDFSAARNLGLQHAVGRWVWWLDAGETIAPEQADELRKFVIECADPAHAYMLLIEAPSEIGGPPCERVGRVRLMPRRAGLCFAGRLNENLEESLNQLGMTVETLEWAIRRPVCDRDANVIRDKAQRDLRIAQIDMVSGPLTPHVALAAGHAAARLGQTERAVDFFRRVVEQGTAGSSVVLDAYYGWLAALEGDPAGSEPQIAACLRGLDDYPLDAQLLCGMGSYMLQQNRLDLAARAFRVAVEHGRIDRAAWHVTDLHRSAVICLSLSLQLAGDEREAEKVLLKALDRDSGAERLRRQLLQLYVKLGDSDAAMATFELLPKHLPGREPLRSAVRGGLLAVQRDWAAAEPYLKTAYAAGCREPLCLRWLAATLAAEGNVQEAIVVLREWQESEPLNLEAASQLRHFLGAESAVPSTPDATQVRLPVPAVGGSRHIRIDAGSVVPPAQVPVPIQPSTTGNPAPKTPSSTPSSTV